MSESKLREALEKRSAELQAWMWQNTPEVFTEQRHAHAGPDYKIERNYWHYGYLIALRDVLHKMTAQQALAAEPATPASEPKLRARAFPELRNLRKLIRRGRGATSLEISAALLADIAEAATDSSNASHVSTREWEFQSAVSKRWHKNPKAAGDIYAIRVGTETYCFDKPLAASHHKHHEREFDCGEFMGEINRKPCYCNSIKGHEGPHNHTFSQSPALETVGEGIFPCPKHQHGEDGSDTCSDCEHFSVPLPALEESAYYCAIGQHEKCPGRHAEGKCNCKCHAAPDLSPLAKLRKNVLTILDDLTPDDADVNDPIAQAYQRVGQLFERELDALRAEMEGR